MATFWHKFFHSGVIAGAKLVSAFVLAKLLALYGGAGGFATFAQYQNIVQIGSGLAGCGAGQGLVRFLAETDSRPRRQRFLGAAFWLGALLSLAVGAALTFLFALAGPWLFPEQWQAWALVTLVTLLLVAMQHVLLSALNGLGATHMMAGATLAAALTTMALAWAGFALGGALGGTLGIVAGTVVMLAVGVRWLLARGWRPVAPMGRRRLLSVWRTLLRYVGMAAVSTLAMPLALIVNRSLLGAHDGWATAGQWSALWRLSDAYLLIFVTLMNIYYLPRLAAARDQRALLAEMRAALPRFVPLVGAGALLLYVLRQEVVLLALSEDFLVVTAWMGWQLAGDVLKVTAWILAQYLWVRGLWRSFVLAEVSMAAGFVVLSATLMQFHLGGLASVLAFAAVSALAVGVNGWLVLRHVRMRE